MNIFLSWARKPQDPDLSVLLSELEKNSHKVIYWVGSESTEKSIPKGTLFHSYADALAAKSAPGIDASEFPPPGDNIIRKLYRVESIVLTMMNLVLDGCCVDERRNLYYQMLRYWLGILKRCKPDAVIFPNMPHFIYDYLIYELAHLFGIKTILFDDTRFPGRLLPFTDFNYLTKSIQEEIAKNRGKQFFVSDLAEDIREYYEPRSRLDYNIAPSYIVDLRNRRSFQWSFPWKQFTESLRDLSVFKKAPRYVMWLLRVKGGEIMRKARTHVSYVFVPDLRKEYEALQIVPDFSGRFVYFPLQKQPERSTSPQGDMFADQILALQILSASLPKDWVIYVKEHPVQWVHFGIRFSSSRYIGYYKKIAQIKNVRLIPLAASSYQLINNSQFVSAVTGSAGWEAALRSKPSVIFGTVWYQDCPGVFKVGSVEDCRQAVGVIAGGFRIDQQNIVNYLKCFDNATVRGFIAPSSGKASKVSKEECKKNISQAIIQVLRSTT